MWFSGGMVRIPKAAFYLIVAGGLVMMLADAVILGRA
jgi:hypothetical protein